MLGRQRHIRVKVQKVVDAGLFTFAFWVAHWIRSDFLKIEIFGGTADIQPFSDYVWLLPIVFISSLLLLDMQGFYDRSLVVSRRRTAWQLAKVCTLSVVVVISALFLFKQIQLARAVPLLFGLTSFLVVLAKEEAVRRWAETSLGKAQLKRRLILAGATEDTARLVNELKGKSYDIEVVARMNLNEAPVEQLVDLLHKHSANGVVLSAQHTYFGQVEKAIQACELEGVEVWLLADFFQTQISQTTFDELHGRPMLVFSSTPAESWQNLAKQIIDVFGALVLLALCGIPMLVIAAIIKLTSTGPVLFRQERSGLNGHPFTMLKFRSMVTDAEQRKHELAALNEMSGPVFKISNDPRVTPIGRTLRRFSLDELPQLINVLRGEMSLVGPRPLPCDEVRRFDDLSHRRRLSVRPGLTCLWQISGRNEVSDFKDWVRLDLEYIDNWSLWLDLKILARTIPVVVRGTGAR